MPAVIAKAKAKEIRMEVRVIRCGCGDPDAHNGVRGPSGVCPTPLAFNAETDHRENYWHRNPLRRLAHAAKKTARRVHAWRPS